MYNLIAIMGKAGSGKDSIMQGVLKKLPELHEVISYTTRPKREREIDGVNYHFISLNEFSEKVLFNEMIECTTFNDWFYGTGYECLDENKINIGVFNPTGIDALCHNPDVHSIIIYIKASDKNRLLRQLNREENPDIEEIIRRYKTDKADFYGIDCEFVDVTILTNNSKEDFDKCVTAIINCIKDNFDLSISNNS